MNTPLSAIDRANRKYVQDIKDLNITDNLT